MLLPAARAEPGNRSGWIFNVIFEYNHRLWIAPVILLSLLLSEALRHMRGINTGIYSAGHFRASDPHIGMSFGYKPLLNTIIA
jgi:hypothetical protein